MHAGADCYLYLVQYDSQGGTCIIHPYGGQKKRPDLYHGIEALFPPAGPAKYDFVVEPPFGQDTIVTLACTERCDFVPLLQSALDEHGPHPGRAEEAAIRRISRHLGPEAKWSACVLYLSTDTVP